MRATTPQVTRRTWIRPVIRLLRIERSTNGRNIKSQCGRTCRSSFSRHTSKRTRRGCLLHQHYAHIHACAPLQARRATAEKTFGSTPTHVAPHTCIECLLRYAVIYACCAQSCTGKEKQSRWLETQWRTSPRHGITPHATHFNPQEV